MLRAAAFYTFILYFHLSDFGHLIAELCYYCTYKRNCDVLPRVCTPLARRTSSVVGMFNESLRMVMINLLYYTLVYYKFVGFRVF